MNFTALRWAAPGTASIVPPWHGNLKHVFVNMFSDFEIFKILSYVETHLNTVPCDDRDGILQI